MRKVPRHLFLPASQRDFAYDDSPLPIGFGQTISQPYIVAYMTECLNPQKGQRFLEVGTGSGYQAAVLAEIVDTVYTIEIIPELGKRAPNGFPQWDTRISRSKSVMAMKGGKSTRLSTGLW